MADKIRPERPGTSGLGGLLPAPGRAVDRIELPAAGGPRRWRERMPTREQLEGLVRNGRLVLPMRYFRGYFLDLYA